MFLKKLYEYDIARLIFFFFLGENLLFIYLLSILFFF